MSVVASVDQLSSHSGTHSHTSTLPVLKLPPLLQVRKHRPCCTSLCLWKPGTRLLESKDPHQSSLWVRTQVWALRRAYCVHTAKQELRSSRSAFCAGTAQREDDRGRSGQAQSQDFLIPGEAFGPRPPESSGPPAKSRKSAVESGKASQVPFSACDCAPLS